MPILETETPLEELRRLEIHCRCLECGDQLIVCWGGAFGYNCYILRCSRNVKHNGITREYIPSPYDLPDEENNLINLTSGRRRQLEKRYGTKTGISLVKYAGRRELQKAELKEIIEAIYPEAPPEEKARAILLCASYHLNPLNKHIFLIPFNKGKENESWATVMGIKAKRLLASRRGAFSYVDNTPRKMTDKEQEQIFGEVAQDRLRVITKVRDPMTGAEAVGYGDWEYKKAGWRDGKKVEIDNEPYGSDKGNSIFNMATIRSESQALDRLRPGEMPEDIAVMEESAADADTIEGEFSIVGDKVVDTETGEIKGEAPASESKMAATSYLTYKDLIDWILPNLKSAKIEDNAIRYMQSCGISKEEAGKDPAKAQQTIKQLSGW